MTEQKWTKEDLLERYNNDRRFNNFVKHMIREALAAEREKLKQADYWGKQNQVMADQLREQLAVAVEALRFYAQGEVWEPRTGPTRAEATLAKIREGK